MSEQDTLSESLWAATAAAAPEAPPLQTGRAADVIIVGAGYTGLSAALHLAERGTDAIVLEAREIGFGGSGRNVGLVNAGLWLAPDEIELRLGKEAGARLNGALGDSPALVFSLIERHGIECEALRNGTLHLAHSTDGLAELKRRAAQWLSRGAPVKVIDKATTTQLTGSEIYHGALYDLRAGTLNPLGYVRGLARAAQQAGASIHCHSPAKALSRHGDHWQVTTPAGMVSGEAVILATNAYSDDLWPGLKSVIIPIHFFQLATKPLGDNVRATIFPERQGAWDTQKVMTSFRVDAAGRLSVGSLGKLPDNDDASLKSWADHTLKRTFPQLDRTSWDFGWSGLLAFTPAHLPSLHQLAPRLLTCLGYSGRGIGPGTVMGKAIAEYLLGRPESELPLPITTPRPVPFRSIRSGIYEASFQTYHYCQRLR